MWRVYDDCEYRMGIVNKITRVIATLGPVGYLPAPGTWGTLCAVPVVYVLRSSIDSYCYYLLFVLFSIAATFCVQRALPQFGGLHDPAHIVIDEYVGFFALGLWMPVELKYVIAGFVLFRLFDITKPLGIGLIERHDGAAAIIVDDVVAALYAAVVLRIFINFGL